MTLLCTFYTTKRNYWSSQAMYNVPKGRIRSLRHREIFYDQKKNVTSTLRNTTLLCKSNISKSKRFPFAYFCIAGRFRVVVFLLDFSDGKLSETWNIYFFTKPHIFLSKLCLLLYVFNNFSWQLINWNFVSTDF